MKEKFLILGGLLAAATVALGAFGAHGLKSILDPASLATFETAVRYQMYHSIALCLCGIVPSERPGRVLVSAALFLAGIFFFCGSLYIIIFTGVRQFGAVAPLGGLSFIAGWIVFALAAFKAK